MMTKSNYKYLSRHVFVSEYVPWKQRPALLDSYTVSKYNMYTYTGKRISGREIGGERKK